MAWSELARFTAYTALINPYVPTCLIPGLAWTATVLELALAALLLLGLFTRHAALASGVPLSLFAVAMVTSLGFKPPLDYSVMSAAAAAFLLAQAGPGAWSVDGWRRG